MDTTRLDDLSDLELAGLLVGLTLNQAIAVAQGCGLIFYTGIVNTINEIIKRGHGRHHGVSLFETAEPLPVFDFQIFAALCSALASRLDAGGFACAAAALRAAARQVPTLSCDASRTGGASLHELN